MSKEIIVNSDSRETRIAVREGGQLVELHIEREERVVGSLYNGRVDNVVAGVDAAFVDIGLERNAFLYAGDIVPGGDEPENDSIEFDRRGRRSKPQTPIRDLVRRGQEMLVQVVKGPRGTKGSRVSTRISLPGRYLVFMPDENSTGVSRKIEEPKERDRLKRIVERVRKPGYGLIVRTEAEGKTERELRQDLEFLERTWNEIRTRAQVVHAPNLVYQDLTLLFRILRDAFGSDVDRLVLDSAEDFKRAHELLDFFGPGLKDRVVLYDGDKPVFEHFGIEQEIARLLGRRVWLRSGGYLVIDQAEALTAIDVNSGRSTGQVAHSDTILQTNLEAVVEIARQLRLRDMGGILVLDLIDMSAASDRKKVESALEQAIRFDKNRCKVSHISPLGLIEMTRKRTGETVNEQMNEPCPYCNGAGRIASPESISIQIQRDLRRLARAQSAEAFLVTCHPLAVSHLVGEEGEEIEALEHQIERGIYVRANSTIHQEKYEIQPGRMDELDKRHGMAHRGQVIDVTVIRDPIVSPPTANGFTPNGLLVHLPDGARFIGQTIRAKLTRVGRSAAGAEAMSKGPGGGGSSTETGPEPPRPSSGNAQERTARSAESGTSRRRRRRGGRAAEAGGA